MKKMVFLFTERRARLKINQDDIAISEIEK